MNTKTKQYIKNLIRQANILEDVQAVKDETIYNIVLRNELSPSDKSILLLCMFIDDLKRESHED